MSLTLPAILDSTTTPTSLRGSYATKLACPSVPPSCVTIALSTSPRTVQPSAWWNPSAGRTVSSIAAIAGASGDSTSPIAADRNVSKSFAVDRSPPPPVKTGTSQARVGCRSASCPVASLVSASKDGPTGSGVVGRTLSNDNRYAIIEYVKSLTDDIAPG